MTTPNNIRSVNQSYNKPSSFGSAPGGDFTPDFTTAQSTRSFEKKLSVSEFVRAIRFSVTAEYEAIQIYEQIVEAIEDAHAKTVITDIINEERLHAGQFLDILFSIAPEEKSIYAKAAAENATLNKP